MTRVAITGLATRCSSSISNFDWHTQKLLTAELQC